MPSLLSRVKRWLPQRHYSTFDSHQPLEVSNGDQPETQDVEELEEQMDNKGSRRDLIAFFVIGLINNFAYVVMLSAAEDIIEANSEIEGFLLPTGAVLLADILPTLIVKIIGPLFMHFIPYKFRVVACVLFATSSYLIVAFSGSSVVSLTGVCMSSLASGFGEITFLALSSHYHINTVTAWSSGTGGAGLAGAGLYVLMTMVFDHRTTLIILCFAPMILAVFFFFVLTPIGGAVDHVYKAGIAISGETEDLVEEEQIQKLDQKRSAAALVAVLPFKERMALMRPLMTYMMPLFLVYWSEYVINQGVSPVLIFTKSSFKPRDGYVYYQMIYQIGVFISRSSANLVPIKRIWVPSVLQFGNLVLCILQVVLGFIPSIYIMFFIILWEGLLGGSVYVNAFRNISKDVDPKHREWSLGVASVADTCGICLAGLTSVLIEPTLRLHRAIV